MLNFLLLLRLFAGFALVLIVPGLVANWFLGLRRFLAVAAAPAVSLLILVGTGVVANLLGWRWSVWVVAAFTVLTWAVLWLVTALLVGRRKLRPGWTDLAPASPTYSLRRFWLMLVFCSVAGLLAASPILWQWNLFLPPEQIDSTFHLNVAWDIAASGNASIFNAASNAYGLRSFPTYYPIAWHALVALVGGPAHIVVASNVGLIVIFLVWSLGIGALALEAFPRSFSATAIAVTASLAFPAFPMYMVASRQLWPNALGYALLPGLLAVTIHMLRSTSMLTVRGLRGHFVALLVAVFLNLAGATASYPSMLFSWAIVMALPLLSFFIDVVVAIKKRFGWYRAGAVVVAAIALPLALRFAVLTWRPGIALYLSRSSFSGFDNFRPKLWSMATLWPSASGMPLFAVTAVLIGLTTVIGLVVSLRTHQMRWVGFGWLGGMLLLTSAYFPIWYLTSLTGLWYNDPYRIIPVLIPFSCLLFGSAWLWIRRTRACAALAARVGGLFRAGTTVGVLARQYGFSAVAVLLCVFLLGGPSTMARAVASRPAYDHPDSSLVFLADRAELQMIRRVGPTLDPGLMILADPGNGSTYFQALGNHRVVFPHLTYRTLDTDARYLSRYFRDLRTDPRVCTILRHYGIGYFFEDEPGKVGGLYLRERSPGFYNVNTSSGFDLVAQSGSARLFRITACGTISAPARDAWQIQPPFEPLFNIYGQRNRFDPQTGLPLSEVH